MNMPFIPEWAEKELKFKSKYTPEQIAEAKGPLCRPAIDVKEATKNIADVAKATVLSEKQQKELIHGQKKRGRPRKEKK